MMTDVDDAAKSADARTFVRRCSATMPCGYGSRNRWLRRIH